LSTTFRWSDVFKIFTVTTAWGKYICLCHMDWYKDLVPFKLWCKWSKNFAGWNLCCCFIAYVK
jgi:hypothetical protein